MKFVSVAFINLFLLLQVAYRTLGQHCITNMKVGRTWKELKSPDYPKFSGKQMQCTWMLEAPIGWRVKVYFKDLSMKPPSDGSCRSQYVEFIDDTPGSSQGRFCGNKGPGDYVSIGTKLRVDVQGDKSVGTWRGFVIAYVITKEKPGHRSNGKTFGQAKSGKGKPKGKINLSSFSSRQKQVINEKRPNPQIPRGIQFVYASEQYGSDAYSDEDGGGEYVYGGETNSDDGWFGADNDAEYVDQTPPRRATTTPAKYVPRRTVAAVRPKAPATEAPVYYDYYESDQQQPVANQPQQPDVRFFGAGRQPGAAKSVSFDRGLPPPLAEPGNNKSSGGLTTTHIIIIAGAAVGVIFIIAVSCLIAKCCMNKKDKYVERHAMQPPPNGYDTWNSQRSVNRQGTLPGHHSTMSSVGGMHRHSGRRPSHVGPPETNVYRNTDPIFATGGEQIQQSGKANNNRTSFRHSGVTAGTLPPLTSVMSQHSIHPSIITKPTTIYTNNGNAAPQRSTDAQRKLQRSRSFSARSLKRNPSFDGRPLPPIPAAEKKETPRTHHDVDEDYYSGDNDDTVTMRREYSDWETEMKNRRVRAPYE